MIEKDFDENLIIKLTELGEDISFKLLCTYPDLFSIGLVFVIRNSENDLKIKDFFDKYIIDTAGNYLYFEHVLKTLIERDLIILK